MYNLAHRETTAGLKPNNVYKNEILTLKSKHWRGGGHRSDPLAYDLKL